MGSTVHLISGKVYQVEGDAWAIPTCHESRRVVKRGHLHGGRGRGMACRGAAVSLEELVEEGRLAHTLFSHQNQLHVTIGGRASQLAAQVRQDVARAQVGEVRGRGYQMIAVQQKDTQVAAVRQVRG